jgi:hypothetical protein
VSGSTNRVIMMFRILKWAVALWWVLAAVGVGIVLGTAEDWPEWTLFPLQPILVSLCLTAAGLTWVTLAWMEHLLAQTTLAASRTWGEVFGTPRRGTRAAGRLDVSVGGVTYGAGGGGGGVAPADRDVKPARPVNEEEL